MSQSVLSVEQVLALSKKQRGAARSKRVADEKAVAESRRASYRVSIEPVSFRLPLPVLLNDYYVEYPVRLKSGKWIVTKSVSTEGKSYRNFVVEFWQREMRVTFEGRLAIKVVAVYRDRNEPDIDAFWKCLLDSLEHAGAYANDKQIKAQSIEQNRIESPGWLDIVLGPKPGERQGTLFETNW